jgi:hypothetical protein
MVCISFNTLLIWFVNFLLKYLDIDMNKKPVIKPTKGVKKSIKTTFIKIFFHTMEAMPKVHIPLPISPPTRAWDELEGSLNIHVIIFHTIAPIRADNMKTKDIFLSPDWISSILTIPFPIVDATAVPMKIGKMNSEAAAISKAFLGFIDLEDMIVATTLQPSCIPLINVNIYVTIIKTTT